MQFFNTPISSPVLIALTVVYAITAAITTFDIRIIQGKKRGLLPPDTPMLPEWTGVFGWLMWGAWTAIFLLNWAYALALFVIKFVLKVLPILERIGGFIVSLFIGKELPAYVANAYSSQMHEQKQAGDGLSLMNKANKPRTADQLHTFLEKVKHQNGMPESLKLVSSIGAIKSADISDNKKQELTQVVERLYNEQ